MNYDWKFKIRKEGYTVWGSGNKGWDSGILKMPEFVAELYIQGDDKSFHITDIRIILNGYVYYKSYKKRYSRRYAVTLAKRFGKELIKGD